MKTRLTGWLGCVALLAGLITAADAAQPLFSASFARGAWDPGAWVIAKNPTVDHLGKWVQGDTYIENETPANPAQQSALNQTLTTMIYGKQFSGNYTVTSDMTFGHGGAPGIVLAQDWAPDAQGRPQYGEFYEAIIYEKGINLWRHFLRDGKPTYEKTAYSLFPLKPDTPYKLQVHKQGKTLEISVADHHLGVLVPSLSDKLFLGVEGCEGICRISDFSVTR